jgi:hypothetical protein
MTKKKEKAAKGFVDYPGKVFTIISSQRPKLMELMRRAIIASGGPNFGDLVMGNAVASMKGNVHTLFIEVAQTTEPDVRPDWITFSIPMKHVVDFVGNGLVALGEPANVRHYRANARYHIQMPRAQTPVFAADSVMTQ